MSGGITNSTTSFGLRGRPATNDYTNAGGYQPPPAAVEILPNMNKGAVQKAAERLPQFVNEPVQSVDVLVSSQNRVNGTNFDFTADIGSTIFRPRLITVDAVVMPKLFNITPKNNTVRLQFGTYNTFSDQPQIGASNPSPTIEFTLPVGYYTPTYFINQFTSSFKTAFEQNVITSGIFSNWEYITNQYVVSVDAPYTAPSNFPPVTVVVSFDNNTNTFAIILQNARIRVNYSTTPGPGAVDGSENVTLTFWIDQECSFIQRGKNFIPFGASPIYNSSNYSLPPYFATLGTSIMSGMAGLRYTRWCTLSSNTLNRFAYAESRVSRVGDGGGRGKIIAVLDTSYYDYVEDGYGGSFIPIQYPNAAFININNAQGQLEQYLDFVVRDEFGDTLDGAFENPLDQLGITFWLKVTF